MNVEIGPETADIPCLGIFVSKFRYFVIVVWLQADGRGGSMCNSGSCLL